MLDPGRYAAFVWPAYGLSAVVLIGALAEALLRSRRWRRAAEAGEAARARRIPAPDAKRTGSGAP